MADFKVSFFIVGLPKSGTSALAQFLSEHSQVCMSYPKEPGYFATDLIAESDEFHGRQVFMKVRSLKEYKSMYKHRKPGQVLGDATPIYLYSKVAAEKIRHHNPEAKIIIILRHPVDFMHSMHMQNINWGTEDEYDFAKVIEKEDERKQGISTSKYTVCPSLHYYKERAKYTEQVKRYLDRFGRKNVLILTHEDFRKDNAEAYEKVLHFIGVDASHKPHFTNVNVSQSPRYKYLHRVFNNLRFKNLLRRIFGPGLYTKIKKIVSRIIMKPKTRQAIPESLRKELERETLPDVKRLSKLINRNMVAYWGYNE